MLSSPSVNFMRETAMTTQNSLAGIRDPWRTTPKQGDKIAYAVAKAVVVN
jgi:hypothetical protein